MSRLARRLVPIVALVAVYFTLSGGQTIVALLLMGYSFVTQLFPALVMSLHRNNPLSSTAVFAGIVVGIATVMATSLTHTTIATSVPWAAGGTARSQHRHRRARAERADVGGGQCDHEACSVDEFRMIEQGHEIPATTGIQATRV